MGDITVTERKIASKKRAPNSSGETKRALEAQKKRKLCLELRAAGADFDQIVATPGTYKDKGSVSRAIKEALAEITIEPAEELIKLELKRLDAMLMGIWGAARTGDVFAIDRVLKIQNQRARYLGLEPPSSDQQTTKDVKVALAGFLGQIVQRADEIEAPDDSIVDEAVPEP